MYGLNYVFIKHLDVYVMVFINACLIKIM